MPPKKKFALPIIVTIIILTTLGLAIWLDQQNSPTTVISTASQLVTEQIPQPIPLGGDLAQAKAEISGLAWYQDQLIFLPQYPDFADGTPFVYALSRDAILAYLDETDTAPLTPTPIPINTADIAALIPHFQGFEGITISGHSGWLTIEAGSPIGHMNGYILPFDIIPDPLAFNLRQADITEILLQTTLSNKANEAVLTTPDGALTLYEVYDGRYNTTSVANLITADSNQTIPAPELAYRLTDVTELDENGRFWAINYYFPNDQELAQTDETLAQQYGQGHSHSQHPHVERLIPYLYNNQTLQLDTQTTPIWLQLEENPRNWEGIARLDERGFLIVTDKFPSTLFAFVPYPKE
ncbi:MAG TPA: hypothetical protein VLL52_24555 [Anaerolineae bacterium]|nr:hypothetical protein [Anaerolineae bacterium]